MSQNSDLSYPSTTQTRVFCINQGPSLKEIQKQLEMVQKGAAQYIRSRYQNRSSVTEILHEIGWKTVEERRKEMCFTMF